jgi:hypothetical protein
MAAVSTGPFAVHDVVVGVSTLKCRSIFDDVEVAKARIMEARKGGSKRKIPQAEASERMSQSSTSLDETSDPTGVKRLTLVENALHKAQTDLIEMRVTREALENRRQEIHEQISKLLTTLGSDRLSLTSLERSASTKKRARYFESAQEPGVVNVVPVRPPTRETSSSQDDDVSTVVCPFELMGSCTDPHCSYMHLNR